MIDSAISWWRRYEDDIHYSKINLLDRSARLNDYWDSNL